MAEGKLQITATASVLRTLLTLLDVIEELGVGQKDHDGFAVGDEIQEVPIPAILANTEQPVGEASVGLMEFEALVTAKAIDVGQVLLHGRNSPHGQRD
jgi:hypothetical protein